MLKPFLTNHHPPVIAAGGVIVISLFVLLTCSLAVDGLTRKILPQTRTCIPNLFTTDVPLRGSDKDKSGVAITRYGEKQNIERCCPTDTTSHGSSQTSSHVFCCPNGFSCSENIDTCSTNTLACPATVGEGCCAIGLRCTPDLCFKYDYKVFGTFQPLPIPNSTSPTSQGFYDGNILATKGSVQSSTLPSSLSTDKVIPTYAFQNCHPENISQKGQDLPITDRFLGIPTAWRAKIGKIAVKSQAEENSDGTDRKRGLRRLGCVVIGLLVITVFMSVVQSLQRQSLH